MFGIVSLYYYRHQLLPVKYAGKIDVYAEKIHPGLKSFARIKSTNNEVAVVEFVSVDETETSVVVDKSVDSENILIDNASVTDSAVQIPPGESLSPEQPVAVTDVPITIDAVIDAVPQEKPADEVAVDIPATPAEIVPPVATVIEKPVEDSMMPETDKDATTTDDLLRAARQAFKDGKLDVAITQYNAIIELDNDDADFYGELGNVHYAIGSWKEAGAAYYEAAIRLIEKRQFAQIRYLQRVLNGLDAELAEKLEYQLASLN